MQIIQNNITQIVTYFFGCSGIVFWLLNYKERKTKNKADEANATIEMQKGYRNFVQDTNALINNLKEEIKEIKEELKQYKQQCKVCNNNKIK